MPDPTDPKATASERLGDVGLPLRWLRIILLVTAAGYTTVTVSSLVLRHEFAPSQYLEPVVVVASLAGLWLLRRGKLGLAGMLPLAAVWAELTWAVHVRGHSSSSLGIYALLVLVTGLLLGEQATLVAAAATILAVPATAILSSQQRAPELTSLVELTHFWLVFAVQMAAAAAIVRTSLGTFRSLLQRERGALQRQRELFDQASDALMVVDEAGSLVDVNRAGITLLGREASQVEGRPLDEVFGHWGLEVAVIKQLRGASRRDSVSLPMLVAPASRPDCWIEISTGPVTRDGREVATQFILRDVSERVAHEENRRKVELQLLHAQKLEVVGRLAGSVAHDFNNVLTAVGGSAELLALETTGSSHALAGDILHATQHGAALTRQLLSFARRDEPKNTIVQLDAVVRESERLLSRIMGERHRLVLELDTRCSVLADRGQMEQVLINLVANGRDAMEKKGQVTVRVSRAPTRTGFARIEVSDTGSGIPEADLPKIFDAFFTTKERDRGTGLGLATVRSLVERWGGEITCQSTVGQGAHFSIELPLVADHVEPSIPSLRTAAQSEDSGLRILVVDDEPGMVSLLKRLLELGGHHVVAFNRALEAEAAALAEPFDLLVLDVMMPERLGTELATHVLSVRPEQPILFISGWVEPEVLKTFPLEPTTNLINKPFAARDLLARVSTLAKPRVSAPVEPRPEL